MEKQVFFAISKQAPVSQCGSASMSTQEVVRSGLPLLQECGHHLNHLQLLCLVGVIPDNRKIIRIISSPNLSYLSFTAPSESALTLPSPPPTTQPTNWSGSMTPSSGSVSRPGDSSRHGTQTVTTPWCSCTQNYRE